MALSKEQKIKAVERLKEAITKQKAMVFVNFAGLSAQDLEELRAKLQEVGAKLTVAKKTLAKLAFKEEKVDFPEEEIQNELAIIFGFEEDEIAPSKVAFNFSKTQENLKITGGYMDSAFIPANEMIALAQLPSKKELLGKLVGTLSAPISNFVSVQRETIKGLMYALKAIGEASH